VNLQENFTDPARTLRAWRRVLDVQKNDAVAVRATVPHARALGGKRDLIDALELQWSITEEEESRVQQALEIARLWEGENDRAAPLASCGRALRLRPAEPTAVAAIARLRGNAEGGVTRGVLDVAAAELQGAERAAMVRQTLAVIPAADARDRSFL